MMMHRLHRIGVSLLIALSSYSAHSIAASADTKSGTPADDAYAAKLWSYMSKNKLVGAGRMRSFPFVGSRPHGSIQEVITTDATVDGRNGRLIVKHNYGAKEKLTPKTVYAADQAKNYGALTVMFRREKGYDPANNDWFWAEYNPDGSVIKHEGTNLSGRSQFCIGCHIPLGGNDREILNGTAK
jgi:hypothetical protein